MYMMAPDQLERYRRAVADDRPARSSSDHRGRGAAKDQVTGHDSSRPRPAATRKDHPRVDLLRNKGLVAWKEWPPAAWLGSRKAKDRVVTFLHASHPLNVWLAANVGGVVGRPETLRHRVRIGCKVRPVTDGTNGGVTRWPRS